MTNVINFPCDNFENLSLTERAMLIEEWASEMEENLDQIRQTVDAMDKLLKRHKEIVE